LAARLLAQSAVTSQFRVRPILVFQFGWNIQSISKGADDGHGNNLIRVTVPKAILTGGNHGAVVAITGANSNTGADGTWTVTRIDAQTFDLEGSTYTDAQAVAAGKRLGHQSAGYSIRKLGWASSVGAYTKSGTNSVTELATQLITMAHAWKYDASYKNLIETAYYGMLQSISSGNREVHPAQYGYAANQWGLFPVSYSLGNQYTNYDAIHEWNA
jgi:hypothetical protein